MSSPPHRDHVALTSFDPVTARAVVAVLRRAGIDAALSTTGREDEVEVTVPDGAREQAMGVLGARMEEVREAVAEGSRTTTASPTSDRRDRPAPDPDDVHAGPPLVMERFRNLSWLGAVLLVPLLAVTIAGPLRGSLRVIIAVALMGVVAVLVLRRSRGR